MFKDMASIGELRKIRKWIIDTTIRGVPNITNVEIIKLSRTIVAADGSLVNNPNCWAIRTTGTNLAEMLTFPDIDHANVQTTAVREIESILGSGAARQRIVSELSNLGMECSNRHLLIYADEMVHGGTVTSIERHGIKAREPKNILLRMGFSSPITTLEEAMVNNTVDELSGITPSYLVGTVPKVGTKYNKLVFNESFIKENAKSANEMISALL
jgi:DNA-directed RNA polymerase beta' subunit